MDKERIKDLVDKGFITKISDVEDLAKLAEMDLIEKGYITQIGIFDGVDSTIDEVIDEPTDEPTDEPELPAEDEE